MDPKVGVWNPSTRCPIGSYRHLPRHILWVSKLRLATRSPIRQELDHQVNLDRLHRRRHRIRRIEHRIDLFDDVAGDFEEVPLVFERDQAARRAPLSMPTWSGSANERTDLIFPWMLRSPRTMRPATTECFLMAE